MIFIVIQKLMFETLLKFFSPLNNDYVKICCWISQQRHLSQVGLWPCLSLLSVKALPLLHTWVLWLLCKWKITSDLRADVACCGDWLVLLFKTCCVHTSSRKGKLQMLGNGTSVKSWLQDRTWINSGSLWETMWQEKFSSQKKMQIHKKKEAKGD